MWCIGFGAKLRDFATFSLLFATNDPANEIYDKFWLRKGGVRILGVHVFGEQMTFENRDTIYGASWRGKVKTMQNSNKVFLMINWQNLTWIEVKKVLFRRSTRKSRKTSHVPCSAFRYFLVQFFQETYAGCGAQLSLGLNSIFKASQPEKIAKKNYFFIFWKT